MPYDYAARATKTIIKAVPTEDENGICRGFEIEAQYSLDGYQSTYRYEIEDRELEDKPPTEFTLSELWALCPTHRWNSIYDSQYESVVNAPPSPTRNKIRDFDMLTLKADSA